MGEVLGALVGAVLGVFVGPIVGESVGVLVGEKVGAVVGATDGEFVGEGSGPSIFVILYVCSKIGTLTNALIINTRTHRHTYMHTNISKFDTCWC